MFNALTAKPVYKMCHLCARKRRIDKGKYARGSKKRVSFNKENSSYPTTVSDGRGEKYVSYFRIHLTVSD